MSPTRTLMRSHGPIPILHVHDRSAWGGNIEHIRQLCLGTDATRYTAMAAGPPKQAWTRRLAEEGITVHPSQIESKWDVGAAVRLSRLLKSMRVGIVHTHIRRADLMGSIAAGLARPTRAVATLHGLVGVNQRGEERFGVSERVYAKVLRHGFDKVITVSEAVRAEAIATLGLPEDHVIHVVNGSDLARFATPPPLVESRLLAGLEDGEIGIGMVSRFVAAGSHMKGHAELLHAFGALVPDHPRARLLLIGDGPSRPEIADLAKQLGLQAAVRFLGHRDDIPALLPALSVSVLPSRGEGLPRGLVESMACGVPCVGTDVGGIPELLRDGAGLVSPVGDVPALEAALRRVLEDRALAARLSEAGRARAQQYDAPAMCRATEAVYDEVLERFTAD